MSISSTAFPGPGSAAVPLTDDARPPTADTMTASAVGLSLILGGAMGNLWDRLLNGRVVDFLLVYIGSYQWPAFNVADSAIVVGAGLLVFEIIFAKAPAAEKSA